MPLDNRLTVIAARCLYGEVGPNLVRFTGEMRDKNVFLQWVVLSNVTEDEIKDYRCVGTEILSHYDEMIDEEFLTVQTVEEAQSIAPLGNPFFCRNLRPES